MSNFLNESNRLYKEAKEFINVVEMQKMNRSKQTFDVKVSEQFEREFFSLVDKVSLSLMDEKDHFYGYFLLQMGREIRFDIATSTAICFKSAKYIINFNPIIFLKLNINQMKTCIKKEILHVISKHIIRIKELKGKYSKIAINAAMDVVVNKYLTDLPPYAVTLEWINTKYELELEPYMSFEYYLKYIQDKIELLEPDDEGEVDDGESAEVEMEYDLEKSHDIWEESDIDEKTLEDFTQKFIEKAQKGSNSEYLEGLIAAYKNNKSKLAWNVYLNKMMGSIESNKRKTVMRRNRRQPERFDLRGTLRNHKAKIAVAIDISGSINNDEFKQAVNEIFNIVKVYNSEVEIIECDDEIRRVYKAKSVRDIKERVKVGGATSFTPVIRYANRKNINLLIYFTDGKGEENLKITPTGYKILWIISGGGDNLSLDRPYGVIKKLENVKSDSDAIDMSDVRSDGYSMNNQAPMF
ncbi:MAG: vWA domain-containing protein [Sarcina sp.]